jgi:hypothetical protein
MTTRHLLATVGERLDAQQEQLLAVRQHLRDLDTTLDARLAATLDTRLAAIERLLSAKPDPPAHPSTPQTGTPPVADSITPNPAHLRTADDTTPDKCGGQPGPEAAVAAASPRLMLADTRKLKHSFLKRFIHDDEPAERTERASSSWRPSTGLVARLLEGVFGICEADPRMGKEGSRVIHPQSHFATGTGAAPIHRTYRDMKRSGQACRDGMRGKRAGSVLTDPLQCASSCQGSSVDLQHRIGHHAPYF